MKTIPVLLLLSMTTGCSMWFGESDHCKRMDATAALPEEEDQFIDLAGEEWLNDAIVCQVNDYVFFAPADPSVDSYIVQVNGEIQFQRSSNPATALLMDANYLHLFARDDDGDGHFDDMSYETWVPGYVSARDWNLDGQPDLRTLRNDGEAMVRQAWLNGEWTEYVIDHGFRLAEDREAVIRKQDDGSWAIHNSDD